MAVRKASDSNLTGKKYNDGSAGGTKVIDVPDAPTVGTPTLNYLIASVPFTPSTKGGAATSYTVTSSPGGITASGSSSPISVSGLSDATVYTFTVKGTNVNLRSGSASPSSSAVTTGTYYLTDTDNFNRTTSGNLGSTSTNSMTWNNVKGTWYADGTSGKSDNTATDNNIATIFLKGTNITNLQVDTLSTGGVGPAFWVTDANNYWAATVKHSTTSGSNTTCSGNCSQTGGYCATCCSGQYTSTFYSCVYNCCDGYKLYYGDPNSTNYYAFYCQVSGRGACGGGCNSGTAYNCTSNQTIAYTNYISNFRLIKNGTAVVDTQYNTNQSAYQSAGSIGISTSGNQINYAVYSAANKGGTTYHSSNYTDNSAVKTNFYGVFKGDGGTNQGSAVDNFTATTS
jgi:hypothetical protein